MKHTGIYDGRRFSRGGLPLGKTLAMSIFDAFAKLEAERKTVSPPGWLLVGLGNPDRKYENTRHNPGFICLDRAAKDLGTEILRKKFDALTAEGAIAGQRVLLMKPMTYMNLSGTAVEKAASFYKIPPERVLVIFDDISLPVGKMRLRKKGSAGGHNGIKSIIDYLGTDAFPRIKVGIGGKPRPEYDLADWVLSRFTEAERREIDGAAANCLPAAEMIIKGDFEGAMAKFNG